MSTRARSERTSADRSCRFRRIEGGTLRIAVEVTHACNLPCPHCFVPRDTRHPALSDLTRSLRDLAAANVGKVIVTGGEPLLRPDLERIVEFCAAQNVLVDLNSNLVGLTGARARSLLSAGLHEASASLYGDRDAHDAFVGVQGAWEKTVQGIRVLRELSIDVDVHCGLVGQSIEQLRELALFCRGLGCGSLTLFSVIGWRAPARTPSPAADTIRSLGESCGIPVRTVCLTPFDARECVMGDGILGLTAGLEWKPCLLAQRRVCGRKCAGSVGEIGAALRQEVEHGDWVPRCHPDAGER